MKGHVTLGEGGGQGAGAARQQRVAADGAMREGAGVEKIGLSVWLLGKWRRGLRSVCVDAALLRAGAGVMCVRMLVSFCCECEGIAAPAHTMQEQEQEHQEQQEQHQDQQLQDQQLHHQHQPQPPESL